MSEVVLFWFISLCVSNGAFLAIWISSIMVLSFCFLFQMSSNIKLCKHFLD